MSFFTFIDGFRDSLIPKQTNKTYIGSADLISVLSGEFGTECAKLIFDRTYLLTDLTWFKSFIKNYSSVNTRKYTVDTFDCDSFSFVLKGEIERLEQGHAFGLLIVRTATNDLHMLNFVVDDDKAVYLVEPQTDTISRLCDTKYTPVEYII